MARSPKKRIYVDMDDVLAETGRMFLRVLEREFGRTVDFDEMRSFHLGESLALDEERLERFFEVVHRPAALAEIDPMPGALDSLARWAERGYEIFVVTGRPKSTREASLAWLERHQASFSEFHFLDKYTSTYGEAHGAGDGLTLADLPGLDFCLAVEDFPGIAPHLADELGIPVALLDRPWNRALATEALDTRAPVVRCHDWMEIRGRFPEP